MDQIYRNNKKYIINFLPIYRLIKLTKVQSTRLVQDNNSNMMIQLVPIIQSNIEQNYKDNVVNIVQTYQTLLKENVIAYNEGLIYYQALATFTNRINKRF